ncbi:hypothetical protein AYI69_g203 [Smittium culicis]|uniref:2-phosphoxylose phosphatase 1 n=1 Tax=Smittium culicis TaxID=133412 RepID=A0A1R1YTP1_9FUNG|nr:hypothetical protein AYI69_g203 [Smittium culicis]
MFNTFRADYNWELFYKKKFDTLSIRYNKLTAGLFLVDFKRYLEELVRKNKDEKNISKKNDMKFCLYSAHDHTIQYLVNSLLSEPFETLAVPFSANIYFEVWKNNSSGKLSIRAIYNNKILKALGLNGSTDPWCDFNSYDYNTFMSLLENIIPKYPSSECFS